MRRATQPQHPSLHDGRLDVILKPDPVTDSRKSTRIGLVFSKSSFSTAKVIPCSVKVRSFSCDSSRAMPSLGPPQPACRSILIMFGPFCFSKMPLIMLPAFSVTSNICPPSCVIFRGLSPRALSQRSGSPENRDSAAKRGIPGKADRCLVSFNYDRDLHLTPGVVKHFFKFLRVLIHINIHGLLPIGFPSLAAEGSGIRSVYDHLFIHTRFLLSAAYRYRSGPMASSPHFRKPLPDHACHRMNFL